MIEKYKHEAPASFLDHRAYWDTLASASCLYDHSCVPPEWNTKTTRLGVLCLATVPFAEIKWAATQLLVERRMMPKVRCPCGFSHQSSPLADQGWIFVSRKQWNQQNGSKGDIGELFECMHCGTVMWRKPGDIVFSQLLPDTQQGAKQGEPSRAIPQQRSLPVTRLPARTDCPICREEFDWPETFYWIISAPGALFAGEGPSIYVAMDCCSTCLRNMQTRRKVLWSSYAILAVSAIIIVLAQSILFADRLTNVLISVEFLTLTICLFLPYLLVTMLGLQKIQVQDERVIEQGKLLSRKHLKNVTPRFRAALSKGFSQQVQLDDT